MSRLLLILALLLSPPALADPPRVVADIAPVHSLAAQVMEGVADPVLLLEPGASPHDFALRPSQARALSSADLVIWVGPALTPQLESPLGTLSSGRSLALLSVAGTVQRRGGPADDDAEHSHGHGAKGNASADHADVHHHETDPHAWLDPVNASVWVAAIAERLATLDPENAAIYRANAERAVRGLEGLTLELARDLAPHAGSGFVVYHDAYRHLTDRFGLVHGQAVTGSDAAPAGARSLRRIRNVIESDPGTCLLIEPQAPESVRRPLTEGLEARIATIDPLGADQPVGPGHYAATLRTLVAAMVQCFSADGN